MPPLSQDPGEAVCAAQDSLELWFKPSFWLGLPCSWDHKAHAPVPASCSYLESTSSNNLDSLDELSYPGSNRDPVPSAGLGFGGYFAPETRVTQWRVGTRHVPPLGPLPTMGSESHPLNQAGFCNYLAQKSGQNRAVTSNIRS